jgi:hypothetical protein
VTTPRPQSLAAEFLDLKRRLKALEANRRIAPQAPQTHLSDPVGNVVVSYDGVRGSGLGKPFLPIPFVPAYGVIDSSGWAATTSGTFTEMLLSTHYVQHAFLGAYITVRCGADATAEVQVLDNNTVLTDPPLTVDVGLTVALTISVGFASAYGDTTSLSVQTRRTAGTTAVWTQVTGAWGTQTPL